MKSLFLKQQLQALVRQCDLSLLFGCGMLGANLLLALVVFGTSARVVVVPPDFKASLWTEKRTVSQTYLEVSLTGLLNQYVSNKFVQQTKEVYELRFVYKNGQLLIKSFILTGVQKD